ncbi:MAG TPA: sensor histidine kinase [Vicinamibacteria bacterium]
MARPASPDERTLGEQDRQRLARDLHDDIGHSLVVFKLCLERIAADLGRGRTAEARQKLAETSALVVDAIVSLRRVILDLRPMAVDELGIHQAIRSYAVQFFARTGIAVHVHLPEGGLPARLPASYETAFYRVLQGALSNALKHSRARTVHVTLEGGPGPAAVLIVQDDGRGFPTRRGEPGLGFGLMAMRQRAQALGGRLLVRSRPARLGGRPRGTSIEMRLPLPSGPRR